MGIAINQGGRNDVEFQQSREEKSASGEEFGEEFKNEKSGLGGSTQEKGGDCDKSRGRNEEVKGSGEVASNGYVKTITGKIRVSQGRSFTRRKREVGRAIFIRREANKWEGFARVFYLRSLKKLVTTQRERVILKAKGDWGVALLEWFKKKRFARKKTIFYWRGSGACSLERGYLLVSSKTLISLFNQLGIEPRICFQAYGVGRFLLYLGERGWWRGILIDLLEGVYLLARLFL